MRQPVRSTDSLSQRFLKEDGAILRSLGVRRITRGARLRWFCPAHKGQEGAMGLACNRCGRPLQPALVDAPLEPHPVPPIWQVEFRPLQPGQPPVSAGYFTGQRELVADVLEAYRAHHPAYAGFTLTVRRWTPPKGNDPSWLTRVRLRHTLQQVRRRWLLTSP